MSLSTIISTAGVDLAELFVELYNSAKIFNHSAVVSITRGTAERILQVQQQFGKFCGKYLNVDLSTPTINLYWYNRMSGTNAGQAVIKKLLNNRLNRTPVNVLQSLNDRRNPAVHVRSNTTTDFIPNPINNSKNTSFVYGNSNTSMMNVIHSPRRARTIDTSSIINPATMMAIIPERRKMVQVINPRFNPEKLSIDPNELQQMLTESTSETPAESKSDTLNITETPETPNTSNIAETLETPETQKNTKTLKAREVSPKQTIPVQKTRDTPEIQESPKSKNRESKRSDPQNSETQKPLHVHEIHPKKPTTDFSNEPEPILTRPVVAESPTPLVMKDEDEVMQIPMDGVILDSTQDGVEKSNEPIPFNRFERRNRRKPQQI